MIPDFQSIMLPLLKITKDKKEHTLSEVRDLLAEHFNLTKEERSKLLSKSKQLVFSNKVGWARTYLKKAGLLEYTPKGHFRITNRGIEVLKENPPKIDVRYLKQFPELLEFIKPTKKKKKIADKDIERMLEEKTPEDLLEIGYEKYQEKLFSDLLEKMKQCSSEFFERLVVELIVKMGYGGSFEDAGEAIGKSGDEGIDGIIKEDKLGLDVIYLQAKKWSGPVGSPEIQKFAGALLGKKAKKGIFITTSKFSNGAIEYAKNVENKIILIDGEQLTKYMVENNIGVSEIASYNIKKIDLDYFIEEQ
ncbi:MAG: Mrr restriction system protein [candidate division TA06 bacterium 34_109]|uniref:Mrr restriction system protein n=1 Tax=candidate division TA06 bacterium 34_109 TaxID=1635277 RepID=A0A101I0Y9_UNCT6|nr:MAG: Mrr restriction system protein [candidate division TA06 bacterium 34_109]